MEVNGLRRPLEQYNGESYRVVELLKELGAKATQESIPLMPVLLSSLKHGDTYIIRQSISSGTSLFCTVLEEMALQLRRSERVEPWLEELWDWMIKFVDAARSLVLDAGFICTKVLALKFLEVCVQLFTPDPSYSEFGEGRQQNFNVSLLVGNHPTLNPSMLIFEANKTVGLLLDLLQSGNYDHGALTVTVINCLAAIAKSRPLHFDRILSALLALDSNLESMKRGHHPSIRFALRTAFIGFLKCTHPSIVESREKLVRIVRAMNLGEATEQAIRQVERISRNMERNLHDMNPPKDDSASGQVYFSGDLNRKRPSNQANDSHISEEILSKRTRFDPSVISSEPGLMASQLQRDDVADDDIIDDSYSKSSSIDTELSPIEKMIAMIAALLAAGKRGVESLEILISNIHSDLLADIVMENMKNLPALIASTAKQESTSLSYKSSSSDLSLHVGSSLPSPAPSQPAPLSSQVETVGSGVTTNSNLTTDISPNPIPTVDSKRDPRRDPRRLDPRRATESVTQHSTTLPLDDVKETQAFVDHSDKLNPDLEAIAAKNASTTLTFRQDIEKSDCSAGEASNGSHVKESLAVQEATLDTEQNLATQILQNLPNSTGEVLDHDISTSTPSVLTPYEGESNPMELEDNATASPLITEVTLRELPSLPLYVELTDAQRKTLHNLAVTRVIEDGNRFRATGHGHICFLLIARLISQSDADDAIVSSLQKHIIMDYQQLKGHELAIHVLYHLHSVIQSEMNVEEEQSLSNIYEKILLAIAKSLLDTLPASDKSFNKLLTEAPLLPDSALRFLEELCHSNRYDRHGKDNFDGDRVTQGLGAVWSLILGRPPTRKACLDIALKCAVHSHDEVRMKAIRLVANKLYPLSYASEIIEQFARNMLLSVVDQQVSDSETKLHDSNGRRTDLETGSEESSVSGSQSSDPGFSENESMKTVNGVPVLSLSHAQQKTALFFALCAKKPSLLHLVFEIYGRAPKVVKQSVHRHVPVLLRNLGSSCSELVNIISNPPEGCENLLMLLLQTMTEEATPSAELIAAVKHLYETKLKDVSVLIPMLASLSKDEVLPIFPRLINLPPEKFQAALARILQGSAHTGPALTPVEVLVAIHDTHPEKDGVPLKKIMDACTACFEQRTVFTQQVLARSLSQLVEQVPLPLLLMRTVIQAIDAFPTLVGFVMEILSKLVTKQIWKMPKLWVGFLKCASQTQPHSFQVLLQLPPPQLESALNKYPAIRGPLVAYASQENITSSLPRQTLKVLGLANDEQP